MFFLPFYLDNGSANNQQPVFSAKNFLTETFECVKVCHRDNFGHAFAIICITTVGTSELLTSILKRNTINMFEHHWTKNKICVFKRLGDLNFHEIFCIFNVYTSYSNWSGKIIYSITIQTKTYDWNTRTNFCSYWKWRMHGYA